MLPQTSIDTSQLFLACRKGDLSKIQELVEQKELELNIRDKWDSPPLYYACLCGHISVVKYLLDNGVKCEASTFDGERCVYGALNDEIKTLLRNYKAVTSSTIRRDLYNESLRRLLDLDCYKDFLFVVQGHKFSAHKCILSARCQYFSQLFRDKWRHRDTIFLNNKLVHPKAFRALLQYLYTARVDMSLDHLEDLIRLAKQCKLSSLIAELEDRKKKVLSFESTKPGVSVTVLCLEPDIDSMDLQNDLAILADQALPPELCDTSQVELPFPMDEIPSFPDVVFSVENHHFCCHKAFFCGRSDYFKALIQDHFGESSVDSDIDLPVITLHEISAANFRQVMYYIYQDRCELTPSNIHDVLFAGDMFLLPGLKRLCSNTMGSYVDSDNIVTVLHTARLFNLTRLEDQCAEFIAENLEKVLHNPEFANFVSSDALTVKERQETDSIPIIDDIRYHITNFVQTFSDMYDADQMLVLIDNFLEDLNLEA